MTRRVVAYPRVVVRWSPDARGRLGRAAFELFAEQGFSATTVPEITARAGLTTRTFFRHFADKREAFFAGDEIPDLARHALASAPAGLDPVTLLEQGLRQVARDHFDDRREEVRVRRALVDAEPALRERDAQKRADLVAVIRPGLEARGVAPLDAALLAELTVLVLHVALDQWLDDPDPPSMADVVSACFVRLRAVLEPRPDGVL
ncbi:TetR/AcrR family transcriptional regulator [Microlunatus spumicola]|uniref:TetR/AcrR family transcriptional regulator n=1 Tax=Microlunatus spumicola TaxID=81499 RepID=A0ABP6XRD6_9ACTN